MKHYFSEKQEAPLRLNKIKARLQGQDFEFYTASGVFSKSKVDRGTELLANSMQISKGAKVLDMGCGIGILGIVAAKVFNADVTMVDINERALDLAKRNVKLNNIKAEVRKSNLYENVAGKFDAIITNPPQKAGKKVCHAIIYQAMHHLNQDGTLQLVARHNKGGRDLSNKMKVVFGDVKDIAKQSGYRVYFSKKV